MQLNNAREIIPKQVLKMVFFLTPLSGFCLNGNWVLYEATVINRMFLSQFLWLPANDTGIDDGQTACFGSLNANISRITQLETTCDVTGVDKEL